jgi:hypothetical protein
MRLEDILEANQHCLLDTDEAPWLQDGSALALEMLASLRGARHQPLVRRLEKAWDAGSRAHPAVALAVKAALFHEPLPAAQAAYFFHEWRAYFAGSRDRRQSTFSVFLNTQPLELLSLSPPHFSQTTHPALRQR